MLVSSSSALGLFACTITVAFFSIILYPVTLPNTHVRCNSPFIEPLGSPMYRIMSPSALRFCSYIAESLRETSDLGHPASLFLVILASLWVPQVWVPLSDGVTRSHPVCLWPTRFTTRWLCTKRVPSSGRGCSGLCLQFLFFGHFSSHCCPDLRVYWPPTISYVLAKNPARVFPAFICDSPGFDSVPICPSWYPSPPAQAVGCHLESFFHIALSCVKDALVLLTPGSFRHLSLHFCTSCSLSSA